MHEITEHLLVTDRHRTAFLRSGDDAGTLVVLVHGWPDRAISWRHQIEALGDAGFLVVAPDMRGYGNSTLYPRHDDYAMERIVEDMLELLEFLGRSSAVWIGHDWGSPVVTSIASHRPDVCLAVAHLCVPYMPKGFTLESLVPLVDREMYPEDQFPAGQWEYWLFYREQFARAQAVFEADVPSTVRLFFRRGNPDAIGQSSFTAFTRINNGWFGSLEACPDLPMDEKVLDEAAFQIYVDGLHRNGFFGPDSWYMNDRLNSEYALRSVNSGRLEMPVLFIHARYDFICETVRSRLADPMRQACTQLSETIVDGGHWIAQEQPSAVNAALTSWLETIGERGSTAH